MITNKILNFLVQVSFPDIFLFRTVLLPFLCELVENNKEELDMFIKFIFIIIDKKTERLEFATKFFECIIFYFT